MTAKLPNNAVKAIVREWLISKNAIFDKLLHEVADQIAPIVAQESLNSMFDMLYGGSREEAFLGLYRACVEVLDIMDEVCYEDDVVWTELRKNQQTRIRHVVNMAQLWIGHTAQRPVLNAETAPDDGGNEGAGS